MKKIIFLLVALSGFSCFLYGVVHIFLEVEQNACRMTYMFGNPRFLRIQTDDQKFPNYGLYYYYEGLPTRSIRKFYGAPVIFVPGNGGSYKQVRSLASVALRKNLDIRDKLRMDYFTIDYDEELTGLHGGYLQKQQQYLQHCIAKVLAQYGNAKKVVLIGHSMGGKVAQSLLLHNNSLAEMVNTMIFISSPLDRPVVYFDALIADFYQAMDKYLRHHRLAHIATNTTNCCKQHSAEEQELSVVESSVEHILLLSVGGGNRDLLVNDVLTSSIYSDVHAMTSAIPNVWLSCDHLAAVWCLQLILVINRFLFKILNQDSSFIDDRQLRLQRAQNYFAKSVDNHSPSPPSDMDSIWEEDERLFYTRTYEARREVTYYQMISIGNNVEKTLYAELTNLTDVNWIFGCFIDAEASLNTTTYHCGNSVNLSNMSLKIPGSPKLNRMAVNLPLLDLSAAYKNLTHLVVRIPVTGKHAKLQIDVHNAAERSMVIKSKPWFVAFDLWTKTSITKTEQGTAYFKLLFPELQALFPALRIYVEPYDCKHTSTQLMTARACIPWARGFEQFHQSTTPSKTLSLLLSMPESMPRHYNTMENPVQLELFLDPQCRHDISYRISFGGSASRLVRNFFPYLPAHLAAILLLVLAQHLSTPANSLKCLTFLSAFLQLTPPLILTVCSLALYGLSIRFALLPKPAHFWSSLLLQLILYTTALISGMLLALVAWLLLLLANCFARTLGLWTRLSNLFSTLLETTGHLFSFSIAVVLISIACYGSGGVALIFAGLIYFMKTVRLYETIRQHLLPINSSQNVNDQPTKKHAADSANIYIQMSQFLLLLFLILLNLPASIACIKSWHNYPYSSLPDNTLVSSLIVLGCLSLIWQLKCSMQPVRGNKIVRCFLYVCASVCLIYCQDSMFRLPHVIAFAFVVILFQRVLSSTLIFKKD